MTFLEIAFQDSIVSMSVSRDFLKKRDIENVAPGLCLLVKGKKGNSDMDLWGMESVEDIRKADTQKIVAISEPRRWIAHLEGQSLIRGYGINEREAIGDLILVHHAALSLLVERR